MTKNERRIKKPSSSLALCMGTKNQSVRDRRRGGRVTGGGGGGGGGEKSSDFPYSPKRGIKKVGRKRSFKKRLSPPSSSSDISDSSKKREGRQGKGDGIIAHQKSPSVGSLRAHVQKIANCYLFWRGSDGEGEGRMMGWRRVQKKKGKCQNQEGRKSRKN